MYPEYGGQLAVRLGKFMVLLFGLKTKSPGPWEVDDIDADPAETKDLAGGRPELMARAVAVLKAETAVNPAFPFVIE